MPVFKRSRTRSLETRIFFTTDIHGSDRCFRKFLNAGTFYGVDHLILGGDITGKSLVPVVRTSGGYSATYQDHRYSNMTEAERRDLEQLIRDNGHYPVVGEHDELAALADESLREQAFVIAVTEAIERWVGLAEERLRETGIRCFITPGNDDYWEIDEPLQQSDVVEFVEGRRVALDETREMITTGYSNVTPWRSPRELDESLLLARLESMLEGSVDLSTLVAVIHPPPFGTDLDQAPAIDSDYRIQSEVGSVKMTSVGSHAVREFLEERQPLLGLHGHVHESRGAQYLGRTLCLNPGSEYTTGILTGAIVTLDGDKVAGYQFVSG